MRNLRNAVRRIVQEELSHNKVSLNEAAGKEAMGIAALTSTRGDAVQKFIDDHNLNARKLLNYIKKGKLSDRMDFVTGLSGKPNNPYQTKLIKMFGELVNEDFKAVVGKNRLISEGRGNAVMRFEGVNWPTYYIEYDPEEADYFYDDVITNVYYSIKKHGFDKVTRPRFINDWSVKFEGSVSDVCFTDNEWSLAVSVIPNEDYFYESNGDLSEYNREATKVFNEIQSMYSLHARSSAWSSAKVKGKIIVNE